MSTLPYFDDLRSAMAFVESSQLLAESYPYVGHDRIAFFAQSPEAFAALIAVLRVGTTIDAPLIKSESNGFREISRVFGQCKIELNLNIAAHCEQVQVGEETVEVDEVLVPAVVEKRTVTRPIYAWDCKPVLAVAAVADEIELPPTAAGWTDEPF